MAGFREMFVYQKSFDLAVRIFRLTKAFPKEELFGLTSQVRNSSRSTCANFGEAYRRRRYKAHLVAKLTDSDAVSVVVGQGPHVVQPIERVNGKFVVFSEGNLVSNQGPAAGLPAATQDGFIALLHFKVQARKGADPVRVDLGHLADADQRVTSGALAWSSRLRTSLTNAGRVERMRWKRHGS